jgi:hypothetical protein
VLYEVHAISGAVVDAKFRQSTPKGFHVAGVAGSQTIKPSGDPDDGVSVA